ncbi:unnamed protein product [Phytomonas sp. Hart1]|nr:unnamed protein product [Phytomonas sp. Hart1]|eukprot:CCW69727.1 unnamed protein product [Phytomonas sp. isolate Hart1]
MNSFHVNEFGNSTLRHHEDSPTTCRLNPICVEMSNEHPQTQTEKYSQRYQGCCCRSQSSAEIASAPKKNEEENVSMMSWSYAKETARHISKSMKLFVIQVKRMSVKQIFLTLICIVMLMLGNIMQILMLNFWLVSFPSNEAPGNYTAFALPGIFYSVLFLMIFIIYYIMRKPSLRFARHLYGWKIIILMGFYDAFNSWLATYAASHTSEMLQSLFLNLSPLYSIFFSKWILHDPRHYFNIWTVIMAVFTIAGIITVVSFNLMEGAGSTSHRRWFILIFFSSIPFRVLMNVYQSLYMILYTSDSTFIEWLQYQFRMRTNSKAMLHQPPLPVDQPREATVTSPVLIPANAENKSHPTTPCRCHSFTEGPDGFLWDGFDATVVNHDDISEHQRNIVSIAYHQGDDTAVKLVMLAGETFFQLCFTLAFLPADAIPWYGSSHTVHDTWTNFRRGINSFFTIPENFTYGSLYTLGFVFNYIGAAYVNHHSVTLCSLITQLSSPLTGLLLVIVPRLNALEEEERSWGGNVAAIIMLILASLAYVVWEQLTHDKMAEGEWVLKTRKLHVYNNEVNDILGNSVDLKPFD